MTSLLRPFLFAKALYLDRRQRKRIEQLERETMDKVQQLLDQKSPLQLELGHSHIHHQDWLTLDRNLECDFFWDFCNGMPFPSDSIDVLYSRNTLQRLSSQQLDFLLLDCCRALKPGGAFFFSVPDVEPVLRAYVENQNYFAANNTAIWRPGWHETGSRIDQVTYMAYNNGHTQFMFDRESVVHLCEKAGLTPTELRSFDTKIDGSHSDPLALYGVARKPA